MAEIDYKKLAEACPLVAEIDDRGGSGSPLDRTWLELLDNTRNILTMGDPDFNAEYSAAIARWRALPVPFPDRGLRLPVLGTPEGREMVRVWQSGLQRVRDICGPTS